MRGSTLLLIAVILAACVPPDILLSPTSGPASGYFEVEIDIEKLGGTIDELRFVKIGGIAAVQPKAAEDGLLRVLAQGGPHSQDLDVVVAMQGREVVLEGAFSYEAPLDPAFEKVMSFGASLTQGVSNATPSFDTQLRGPSLALARQLGAWVPQPLLVPGLLPSMGIEHVGPPPECEHSDVVPFITSALTDAIEQMRPPDGSVMRYEFGRVDPYMKHGNIAVGNFRIEHVVRLPTGAVDSLVPNFLGHLAYEPFAVFGEPLTKTPIELIEEQQPSLVFSTDFYGNDGLDGTPAEQVEADMTEVVERLAAAADWVFLADLPYLDALPGRRGRSPERQQESRELVDRYNGALRLEAARFSNVIVVPISEAVDEVHEQGFEAGGEVLTTDMLGGLLSFDGLHFSATGYALLMNEFIECINSELGTQVSTIDLATVMAEDPNGAAAVRSEGREPGECRSE